MDTQTWFWRYQHLQNIKGPIHVSGVGIFAAAAIHPCWLIIKGGCWKTAQNTLDHHNPFERMPGFESCASNYLWDGDVWRYFPWFPHFFCSNYHVNFPQVFFFFSQHHHVNGTWKTNLGRLGQMIRSQLATERYPRTLDGFEVRGKSDQNERRCWICNENWGVP